MKGPLSKRVSRSSEIPAEIAPDVNRGKAIAASSAAIVIGGGFTALAVSVVILIMTFVVCVLWGIGIALTSV